MRNLIVGGNIIQAGVLRPEGGSQFIRAVFRGLEWERGTTSCGDSEFPGRFTEFQGEKGPRGRGSGVAELKETRGTILGRWHLPVWFLPGYCSPRGWSPRQCIWSPRRRVSSHLTSHEQEPKVKCQTNWFLKGVIRERFFILTIICLACLQGLGSVLQILSRVKHSFRCCQFLSHQLQSHMILCI